MSLKCVFWLPHCTEVLRYHPLFGGTLKNHQSIFRHFGEPLLIYCVIESILTSCVSLLWELICNTLQVAAAPRSYGAPCCTHVPHYIIFIHLTCMCEGLLAPAAFVPGCIVLSCTCTCAKTTKLNLSHVCPKQILLNA